MDSPGDGPLPRAVFTDQQYRDRAVRQLRNDRLDPPHARAHGLEQGLVGGDGQTWIMLVEIVFHEIANSRPENTRLEKSQVLFQSTAWARLRQLAKICPGPATQHYFQLYRNKQIWSNTSVEPTRDSHKRENLFPTRGNVTGLLLSHYQEMRL